MRCFLSPEASSFKLQASKAGGSELEASSVLRVLDSELSRIHHGVAADETIVQ